MLVLRSLHAASPASSKVCACSRHLCSSGEQQSNPGSQTALALTARMFGSRQNLFCTQPLPDDPHAKVTRQIADVCCDS